MAEVQWFCKNCKTYFEGSPTSKKCPEGDCQSKDIIRIEDPKQNIVNKLMEGGIKPTSGSGLLADIILQDPNNEAHVWETLSDAKVEKGKIITFMKAYFVKNSSQLNIEKLERGEIQKEKNLTKTSDSDIDEEIETKKRLIKEADRTMELKILDQQLDMKMRRLDQMQGYNNPSNNPQQNQPPNGGNPWGMSTTTIEEEVGYDEQHNRPIYRKTTVPINPYTGAPLGATQEQDGSPPIDPLAMQDQILNTTEKIFKLSKDSQPPPVTGDTEEMKELKKKVETLQEERNKKELEAVSAGFDKKLTEKIAKLKEDQGNKSKEQVEAETGKEFVQGVMNTISEQQRTHNVKMETLIDKGLDIVTKKMGGKDEIISKDELDDLPPSEEPRPIAPSQPPLEEPPVDDRRTTSRRDGTGG